MSGDECAGGGSASGRASGTDDVWREGGVGLGDSTRLISGGRTRRRGSEEVSDCGDGERALRCGVASGSCRSLSTSI